MSHSMFVELFEDHMEAEVNIEYTAFLDQLNGLETDKKVNPL